MQEYLRLETTSAASQTIFVYPDAENRYWPQWNYYRIGWLTGQTTANEDFILFDDILTDVGNHHCIDLSRVYVTGQSWGGDMSASLPCARGDKIAAAVSVASNDPHFFNGYPGYYDSYPPIQPSDCQRPVPMMIYRGATDSYPSGNVSDWWYRINQCQFPAGNYAQKESINVNGRYEDQGCIAPNIYVRYSNVYPYMYTSDHQIPKDYETETMNFFSQYQLP